MSLSSAAALAPCTWCGATPGSTCTVRAAHPTTGRAISVDTLDHVERIRAAMTMTDTTPASTTTTTTEEA